MSAQEPTSIVEWLQGLPIPWLVGGANGKAEVTAYGGVMDAQVATHKAAAKARFPDYAPDASALTHLGAERLIVRGPNETDASFATRLRTAWDSWSRAGAPAELLAQLWFAGWDKAVIITQNGLALTLSAAPTPGADPTSLLSVTSPNYLATALTSGTTPSQAPIPASSPWYVFDGNISLGNRFALLFPQSSTQLQTFATVSFSNSNTGTATWNKPPAQNSSYSLLISAPVITDGSGPVFVSYAQGGTATTITLEASAAFTGTATVWAFPDGADPFCNYGLDALGALSFLVRTWRPARALCMGAVVPTTGRLWGWSATTWGAVGKWGPCEAVTLPVTWT